jgi:hypothetical protein
MRATGAMGSRRGHPVVTRPGQNDASTNGRRGSLSERAVSESPVIRPGHWERAQISEMGIIGS